MNESEMWRKKKFPSVLLYSMSYREDVQFLQPLLIQTDQPPVACSDQPISLFQAS